jgi:hypothetical protein
MKNEWIGCLFKVTRHAISMDGTVGQRNWSPAQGSLECDRRTTGGKWGMKLTLKVWWDRSIGRGMTRIHGKDESVKNYEIWCCCRKMMKENEDFCDKKWDFFSKIARRYKIDRFIRSFICVVNDYCWDLREKRSGTLFSCTDIPMNKHWIT